mmetsp:Transcript_6317/g.10322  ORF Transcript_6317/g.10322 Transcript_6317/m.10322 type:complete len:211 (-) Transcript_6317:209-841(-)
MTSFDYLFKYIIIGDSGVGKSCLLLAYTDGRFKDIHETTIGVEFGSKTIHIDSQLVKLQIWDTAGQETFHSITRSYYRGAIACILVYDVTRRSSFEHLKKWFDDAASFGGSELKFTLVGNKIDKESQRVVSTKEGIDFANEHDMEFMEVSAKQVVNVTETFELTARNILDGINRGTIDTRNEVNGIRVGRGNNKSFDISKESGTDSSGCC